MTNTELIEGVKSHQAKAPCPLCKKDSRILSLSIPYGNKGQYREAKLHCCHAVELEIKDDQIKLAMGWY